MTDEWSKVWRKTDFVSKMTRIWSILTLALEILEISTLIDSFRAKYIIFDLKKYRGRVFHDTEEWCKIC